MSKVTFRYFKKLIKDHHGSTDTALFISFLKDNDAFENFKTDMLDAYNKHNYTSVGWDKGDVKCNMEHDVICSGIRELSSCFIGYDKSSMGEEYWAAINLKWQKVVDNMSD